MFAAAIATESGLLPSSAPTGSARIYLRTRSDALSFRCHSCGLMKAAADFSFSDQARDTLSYDCRPCHAAVRRAHYLANKPVYIRRAIAQRFAHRELNRREVLSYLASHPCIDCGVT